MLEVVKLQQEVTDIKLCYVSDVDEANDVTYALIKFKKQKQKSNSEAILTESSHDPEESAVYSDVRTAAAGTISRKTIWTRI